MSNEPILTLKLREMSDEAKEELIRKIEEDARENEIEYFGCSQVVLDALQRHLNIGNVETFKAATALAGGVGAKGEVCGALLGGVLAIGLVYGRANLEAGKVGPEQPEFVESRVRAGRLCDRFKEKFGSLRCADVKVAVNRKEYPRFNTVEAFEDHAKCADVTGPAARFAAEIILQPTELFASEINALLEDMSQIRKQQKQS